jgi:hypothetical protein
MPRERRCKVCKPGHPCSWHGGKIQSQIAKENRSRLFLEQLQKTTAVPTIQLENKQQLQGEILKELVQIGKDLRPYVERFRLIEAFKKNELEMSI